MSRPIHARIELSALARNLAAARRFAGGARVFAVAKAAAYGHGLDAVMPVLHDADGIALLDLEDAAFVRSTGYGGRLALLEGCFDPADLVDASRLHADVVVHDVEQVRMLETAARGTVVGVMLKFNSGMNRLGFDAAGFRDALARLDGLASVRSLTLMTHFASSDEPDGVADALAAFEAVCGDAPHPRCTANSAALIAHPATRADWVRPGVMLYGASPFADRSAADLGLLPVMTFTSALVGVQSIAAGARVGYGGRFVADRSMRIGVVACGYADGYPRHAPTGTPVLVDGIRTRVVGRVSMDMITVDLGPVPAARVGSAVTLWGDGLPVDEVATAAGTIGYELLCALAPRVRVTVVGLGTPAHGGANA